MNRKKLSIVFLGVICCLINSLYVSAAEVSEEVPAGFSVESIIPDNQIDITKSYFYLHMEPDNDQVIQVRVRSKQKEAVTVKLSIHDAVSSSVGEINYAEEEPKLDESLKNPISEIVTIKGNETEIEVENFEEKIVEYRIKTPISSFEGVKLGSLRFSKKSNSDNTKEQKGVTPEYAYVIAIMLTETEDKESFKHGAELYLKNVELKMSNGRKVVAANIQNSKPKILQDVEIKGRVIRKEEKKTLSEYEMNSISIAPNSNFDFEIPLNMEKFRQGTYIFKGEAKGDNQTWKWEQEFAIDREKASEINNNSLNQLQVPPWVVNVSLILIFTLIGIISILLYRQKQWEKEDPDR